MFKELKELYESLADEESKMIFRQRMLFSITGDWKYFKEMLLFYRKETNQYKNFLDVIAEPEILKDKEVILFGTGVWGRPVKEFLKYSGIGVAYYCDNNSLKVGTSFDGIEVISAKDLEQNHKDAYIVISTEKYETEVSEQLIACGFSREQIIGLRFSDKTMYMDDDIVKPIENEIFVDGGCFDAESSLDFIKWGNGNVKKVYAFEPDLGNYEICRKNFENQCQIEYHLEQAGLWSEKTELCFIEEHGAGSRLGGMGTIKVPVVSLDEVLGNEKVTFIKMDIEGAEMEALKGAQHIIQRCRPRLAICLYHKKEDILDIPLYVKQLLPDYKLYIRHYIPYYFDTVLYAVPKE